MATSSETRAGLRPVMTFEWIETGVYPDRPPQTIVVTFRGQRFVYERRA